MFSDDVELEYRRLAMDWGSIRKTWWLFFMAAGGCGYRGPQLVGQPTAGAIAGLRGRPAVKAAIQPRCFASACPNNNSPDRSSTLGSRRAVYASRLHLRAGEEDSSAVTVLVPYMPLANFTGAERLPRCSVFWAR